MYARILQVKICFEMNISWTGLVIPFDERKGASERVESERIVSLRCRSLEVESQRIVSLRCRSRIGAHCFCEMYITHSVNLQAVFTGHICDTLSAFLFRSSTNSCFHCAISNAGRLLFLAFFSDLFLVYLFNIVFEICILNADEIYI